MADLAALADFIASPDGEIYGRLCTFYGRRPGELFSDDVIAFQVDLAYMLRPQLAGETEETMPTREGFLPEDFWKQEQ